MRENPRVRAVLLVLLAAVCFGTTGTAQALGPDADPVALGAARIAVGGLGLALVALVADRWSRRRGGSTRAGTVVGGAVTRRWRTAAVVGLGALGVLAYQPAFFLGTTRNGVAVGTVVALGAAPVVTGLLAWLVRRERPGTWWAVATALATAGLAVLGLGPGAPGGTGLDVAGVLASVGAGAAYAVYTVAGAALIGTGLRPTVSMAAMFGTAGVLSVGVLAVTGTAGLTSPAGLATVLWLGLVTTTLAYVLFGHGLARLGAPTVATLTLAEPLTATVLGLAVLGERLAPAAVAGLVVLAAGLVVLAVGARARRAPAPAVA